MSYRRHVSLTFDIEKYKHIYLQKNYKIHSCCSQRTQGIYIDFIQQSLLFVIVSNRLSINSNSSLFSLQSSKGNTLHSRSSMGGDGSTAGGPPGAPPGSLIGSHGGGSSIGGGRVGTRYSIEQLEFQTKNGV